MASKLFNLPDPGEGLTEAEVVSWKVQPGDEVGVNDLVIEVETAKSLVELPIPFAGKVLELLVAEGDDLDRVRPPRQGLGQRQQVYNTAARPGGVRDQADRRHARSATTICGWRPAIPAAASAARAAVGATRQPASSNARRWRSRPCGSLSVPST